MKKQPMPTKRPIPKGGGKKTAPDKSDLMFNAITDLVSIHDEDFRIIRANKAFADAFGVKAEELAGKKCYQLIHGTEGPWPNCPHRQTMECGKPRTEEFWEPRLQKYLQVSASPIWNGKGTPIGTVHIVKDITERKQAEERLLLSEQTLRRTFDQAPLGAAIMSLDNRYLRVNAELCRITGYSEQELLLLDYPAITHPEDLQRNLELTRDLVAGKFDSYQMDKRYIRKDGKIVWVRMFARVVKDPSGKAIHFLPMVEDITERKQADEAFRRSEESARRLVKENAVMAEIGRIVSSTLDIDEVYEQFAGCVRKLIQFDNITVTIINFEESSVFLSYASGTPIMGRDTGSLIALAGTATEEVRRTRSGLLIQNANGEETISQISGLRPAFEAGMRSGLIAPLISRGQVFGALNILSSKLDFYTRADLKMAEKLAYQIGGAISNAQLYSKHKRAEESLWESEQKLKAIFESTPIPAFVIDKDHAVMYWNKALEEISGIGAKEVTGTKQHWRAFYGAERPLIADLLVDERFDEVPQWYGKKCSKSRFVEGAYEGTDFFADLGESGKWLRFTAALIRDSRGNLLGSLETLEDITERKQAELALRESEEAAHRLARENAVMAEIGRIISSNPNIDEVYKLFAEKVKGLLSYDRIVINLLNKDGVTLVNRYAEGDFAPGRNVGEVFPMAGTITEKVIQNRRGFLFDSPDENEGAAKFPGLVPEMRAGFRSFLSIPLISRDQPIGGLHFRSKKYRAYGEKDLKLAERIAAQIAGAIANARLFTERKMAEEALRESEEKYRSLVANALDAIFIVQDDNVKFPNPKTLALSGYSEEELSQLPFIKIVHPDDRKAVLERFRRRISGEIFESLQSYRCLNRAGEVVWVQVNSVITLWEGRPATINFLRDITHEKMLEGQLLQAQKVEAIGTLAGGIAHDFNNILSAIIGYAELAGFDLPENSQARYNLEQSLKASQRAKDLVQQILAFSRQGKQERKLLNPKPLIKEGLKLLRASLPATIEIRQEIVNDLGTIKADPTQIHQVLMNLGTNAAHAMSEHGGVLEVSLCNVDLDEGLSASSAGIEPGPYLRFRVRDTGHGMTPEILKRIFDPYFTTKEVGKGTGLGLAVVDGIVKSHGGGIAVSSAPRKGTTFDVYLPRVEAFEAPSETEKVEPLLLGGQERVLFVDDEQAIAEIGKQTLEHLGYAVEVRTSPIEALELFRGRPDRFDLVITDTTMPNMTGDKLVRELLQIRPGLPVILCTGFSERITEEKAKAMGIREFVMKPLVMKDLARAIRRALDWQKERKG